MEACDFKMPQFSQLQLHAYVILETRPKKKHYGEHRALFASQETLPVKYRISLLRSISFRLKVPPGTSIHLVRA